MRKWKPYCNPRDNTAWYSVTNMYPTRQGSYRSAPGFKAEATNANATPGDPLRAAAFGNSDGDDCVVGTTSKLWVKDTSLAVGSGSSVYTDRSAGSYGTVVDWTFAKMGAIMFAACRSSSSPKIQFRDTGGTSAFADIAAAPTSKIVVVQSNALLGFGAASNGDDFQASDVGDYTNWTTGEAVGSTLITHRPGQITAAIAFQDYVLAFKEDSTYRLRYVGGTVKWSVELVADGIGNVRPGLQTCVPVTTGQRAYFWDKSGPMMFDGVSFTNLGADWGNDPFSPYGIVGGADAGDSKGGITCPLGGTYLPGEKAVVWWTVNGTLLVYNEVSDAWGRFTPSKAGANPLSATSFRMVEFYAARPRELIHHAGIWMISLADGTYYSDLTIAPTANASVKTPPIGDELYLSNFTGLVPVLLNPTGIPATDTTSTLASTDLKLNVRHGKNPFYFGENVTYGTQGAGVTSLSANPITSSNDQVRFDFTVTDRWADFEVYASGKFFEIEDVIPLSTKAGLN